jgi:hypothetical protein
VRLIERLKALEQVVNTAPMLTLDVDTLPTPDQTALIERCARTGRKLIVFFNPGDTAWMPGYGVAPWAEHGNA